MLEASGPACLIDLEVHCQGDLRSTASTTVEDVGIVLGQAIAPPGDCSGIRRYADATVPLDEALVRAVIDVSGRPYLSYHVDIARWQMLGDYDVFLTPEFFRALVFNAGLTVHLDLQRGENPHHIVKPPSGLRTRSRSCHHPGSRVHGVPSTKGTL
jgi:imidazoleglycerol-phosphate dehydratase